VENSEGMKVEWLNILEQTNDGGILLLMDDNNIHVDERDFLIINKKSYIASTKLLNRVIRLSDIKKIFNREKIINGLL
tara:strand:- start:7735 stop:7968 length:234 start_codon:yes stop_codon:yes gene_type:complete